MWIVWWAGALSVLAAAGPVLLGLYLMVSGAVGGVFARR